MNVCIQFWAGNIWGYLQDCRLKEHFGKSMESNLQQGYCQPK
jgi:hypothetical protein